ncbi:nicotinate-nucleotide adenylyltransferase [Rickettsiales bacterium LUAb2]
MKTNNLSYIQIINLLKQWKNSKIGLMGGSYNPPHYGHLNISNSIINKFNLNVLIWLVSPQNPLKNSTDLLDLNQRLNLCNTLTANNPKILAIALEQFFNSNYSYNTIKELKKIIDPSNQLFWIMGEDNLANFSNFRSWQQIANLIPIITIAREANSYKSLLAKAPTILKNSYLSVENFNILYKNNGKNIVNKWTFLLTKKQEISSTIIRNNKGNYNEY